MMNLRMLHTNHCARASCSCSRCNVGYAPWRCRHTFHTLCRYVFYRDPKAIRRELSFEDTMPSWERRYAKMIQSLYNFPPLRDETCEMIMEPPEKPYTTRTILIALFSLGTYVFNLFTQINVRMHEQRAFQYICTSIH
jgi:hypothetical protein